MDYFTFKSLDFTNVVDNINEKPKRANPGENLGAQSHRPKGRRPKAAGLPKNNILRRPPCT